MSDVVLSAGGFAWSATRGSLVVCRAALESPLLFATTFRPASIDATPSVPPPSDPQPVTRAGTARSRNRSRVR